MWEKSPQFQLIYVFKERSLWKYINISVSIFLLSVYCLFLRKLIFSGVEEQTWTDEAGYCTAKLIE